jgi:hypothetical protein
MRDLKSRNRPQRERLACFQAGISVVKKVKLAVEISTRKRYLSPNLKVRNEARYSRVRSERALGMGCSAYRL